MRFVVLLAGLGALFVSTACSENVRTSILLNIQAEADITTVDELRLAVFSEVGREVYNRRLPPQGKPTLPNTVVLYPRLAPDVLRLHVRALDKNALVGEGVAVTNVQAGSQLAVHLLIKKGALPDADGDGVPDEIDNCRHVVDPEQKGSCDRDGGPDDGGDRDGLPRDGSPHDGGLDRALADGPADGPRRDGPADAMPHKDLDLRPDQTRDVPARDLPLLPDGGCTRDSQCDDQNACTTERCSNGQCVYVDVSCPQPAAQCKEAICDPKNRLRHQRRPGQHGLQRWSVLHDQRQLHGRRL
jgi:hypothetical protein